MLVERFIVYVVCDGDCCGAEEEFNVGTPNYSDEHVEEEARQCGWHTNGGHFCPDCQENE